MSDDLWIALIAAGAAIVASFGAQIIGAIVSHKQEKRRVDLEERKLFADTRRVAFVSYLQTRSGFADDIWELYIHRRRRGSHQHALDRGFTDAYTVFTVVAAVAAVVSLRLNLIFKALIQNTAHESQTGCDAALRRGLVR